MESKTIFKVGDQLEVWKDGIEPKKVIVKDCQDEGEKMTLSFLNHDFIVVGNLVVGFIAKIDNYDLGEVIIIRGG